MKRARQCIYFLPAIVWMIVIFCFSSQAGPESENLSYGVTREVAEILHDTIMKDHSVNDILEVVEVLHPGIRKTAHLTEYAILFVLLYYAFSHFIYLPGSVAAAIFVCAMYSISDEAHQFFVPGREGSFLDVCVDMTGVLAAVMLLLFIFSLRAAKSKKQEKYEEKLYD